MLRFQLMVLSGKCGDELTMRATGADARQCIGVLRALAEDSFFVEDDLAPGDRPERHTERLAAFASCFDSQITAQLDGVSADAKDLAGLAALKLAPDSRPEFGIDGADADQARAVLENLTANSFYVEDEMVTQASRKGR